MDDILKTMDLDFLGMGQHKITPENFLEKGDRIFLDVRAKEEVETLRFDFKYFGIETIHIPINELPDSLHLLPKDKLIGTFCCTGTRSAWAFLYLLSKDYVVRWIDADNETLTALLKPGFIFHRLNKRG